MPQIIFKGIKEDSVKKLSKTLPKELSDLTKIRQDWFTIEFDPIKFYLEGEVVSGYPVINVNWFDRGKELQDEVAVLITKKVLQEGYETVDVIFNLYEKKNYYENGECF